MNTINAPDIVDVKTTFSIEAVNELLKQGYKLWGKPEVLWIGSKQRHMKVFTLVMLKENCRWDLLANYPKPKRRSKK